MLRLKRFIILICVVAVTVYASLCALWAARRDPKSALRFARDPWGERLLALAGANLKVNGLERLDLERPAIYVMNHQSLIDVPAAFCALPINLCFVAKSELRRVPVFGRAMSSAGMIFVDRRDPQRAIESLREGGELIRSGVNVMAFPEGTRSPDGEILPFKRGVFLLALEAKVPIIPMYIHGAREVLPLKGFQPTPGEIEIEIGAPIIYDQDQSSDRADGLPSPEVVAHLSSMVRDAVLRLKERHHSRSA